MRRMVGPTGITVVYGAIAQLVEHLHGMQGVSGSNPLGSIEQKPRLCLGFFVPFFLSKIREVVVARDQFNLKVA